MAGRYSKTVSALLLLSFAIQLTACEMKSTDDLIGEAASQYAAGHQTESFVFMDSEEVLDEQIELFTGSYYRPKEKQLTDDEYVELMKDLVDPDFELNFDDTETSDPTDNTEPSVTTDPSAEVTPLNNLVSSMDDLERIIHYALDETSESISFSYANGFYVDLSDCINDIYVDLQRVDPLDASGVEEWEWWYRGNDYTLFIHYGFAVDEFIQMKSETASLVQNAVSYISPDGKTDYEIVCAVNDYLCDRVYYPESEPYAPVTHTAYGALHDGCAVCEGYACATKLILSSCGVESDIEVGVCTDGGDHAWNLVKIDGVWYQLDICWNDGSGVRDKYLLVDDRYMQQSRTWRTELYPVCNDSRYVA